MIQTSIIFDSKHEKLLTSKKVSAYSSLKGSDINGKSITACLHNFFIRIFVILIEFRILGFW